MKASRLLSIVLLLQSRGRLTGRDLARRLEISLRTLHRDMDALSSSGVPVYALRGARGGWELDPDWRMRVPALEGAEMRALLLAQPKTLGGGRMAAAAEQALEKLIAALPEPMRHQAAAMRQRLHVDSQGWWGPAEDLSALPIVQEALSADRRLSIRYAKPKTPPNSTTPRTVDPLGLVAKGGSWYLVAGTAQGPRTFRVSRIEEATVLAETFERPPRFDLAAHWKKAVAELERERSAYSTVLRLTDSAARSVDKWRKGVEIDDPRPEAGWCARRVSFEDEDQALFVVLGFGTRVEVLAPLALRRKVRHEASQVAALSEPTARAAGRRTR
jgi:predicted DNA-binding transcriptional regulator YafY